jgi:ubiquinone/menaquinone biosynthesis C-methylase UbiE
LTELGHASEEYLQALLESLPRPDHPRYERWLRYALDGPSRVEPHLSFLASRAASAEGGIIDVGSGDGAAAEVAARLGLRIVLVDCSFQALRRARLRRLTPAPGIVQGDAAMMPFRPRQFCGALVGDVLEHVPDPVAVLREIHRVLVPDAPIRVLTVHRFAVANVQSDPHWSLFGLTLLPRWAARFYLERIRRPGTHFDVFTMPTRRSLQRWLREAGFEGIEVRPPGMLPPAVIEVTAYRGSHE